VASAYGDAASPAVRSTRRTLHHLDYAAQDRPTAGIETAGTLRGEGIVQTINPKGAAKAVVVRITGRSVVRIHVGPLLLPKPLTLLRGFSLSTATPARVAPRLVQRLSPRVGLPSPDAQPWSQTRPLFAFLHGQPVSPNNPFAEGSCRCDCPSRLVFRGVNKPTVQDCRLSALSTYYDANLPRNTLAVGR
jgi:hypothetical protein